MIREAVRRAGPACWRAALAATVLAVLPACSMLPAFLGGTPDKPQPAELAPNPNLIGVRQAWTARLGRVELPLTVSVTGRTVWLADSEGTVATFDAGSGRELWRLRLDTPVTAGIGSDGTVGAVVTRANEVVAVRDGRELWRQTLGAQSFTSPLVAGGRVFVLAGDRSVSAFDAQSGRRLWTQQRPGEPLVLRQAGVILAVGDTLVVGQAGRLAGLNPLNGTIRWEAPIATPRGTNDIERLVELVGPVSRVGDSVCTRAYQAGVGCVDASRGQLLWTKPSNGAQGVHGDDRLVFGTEADGRVMAWRRDNGERAWVTDRLQYRTLSAPLALGRSVVVGDGTGLVHLLSREDGSLLTRLTTDGSALAAAPVSAADTLVVVTRNGGVFGFVPQ